MVERIFEKQPLKRKIIAEGKTKIIWDCASPELVLIESKDDITAGDGLKRDNIAGKSKLATETTANCFRLLNKSGIPTHFIETVSPDTFVAKKASMVPIESVARRIAFGSYLLRHPEVLEGHKFRELKQEFFYKDDANHDPLIEYDLLSGVWRTYNPKLPKRKGFMGMQPLSWLMVDGKNAAFYLYHMNYYTREVFFALEKVWKARDVTLVDLKIEFGFDQEGRIMVADVIDNDSWRIWPGGDRGRMLDKQRYRDGADLDSVKLDYQKVAEMTRNFSVVK